MAFDKRAIFHFKDVVETGVDSIPISSQIFVDSLGCYFVKISDVGLTTSTTIQNALDLGRVVPVSFHTPSEVFNTTDIIKDYDYSTETKGGVIKMRLDVSNPAKPILYMTNDGTNP